MFKRKKGYAIIPGGIEYTRPPYSKVDKFLGCLAIFGISIFGISTLVMLVIYFIQGGA